VGAVSRQKAFAAVRAGARRLSTIFTAITEHRERERVHADEVGWTWSRPVAQNCAEGSTVVEGRVGAGEPNGSMNCPSKLLDTGVSVPYSAGHDRGK
jgi:hypothetical protein